MIKENLNQIKEQIRKTCEKAGRDAGEITLVAVSKTKPLSLLKEAYDGGNREFGENKVQEIVDKYEHFSKDVHWHMIGHLQRNKVKYIIDKVCLIHSVDSFRLAEEINIQAKKKNLIADILLEINIAQELSKFGVSREDTLLLAEQISGLSQIRIKGLMTVAPFEENPENNRKFFRQIKELSVDIMKKNIDNVTMDVLSMGMTNDYLVAIEEGATLVRVGTGIFGERKYAMERN